MAMDSAARPRVLIADENASTRLHVQQILSGAYEVHAVGDGETALAAVREHSPDLVLADTTMPLLDGIGLLCALRNDPGTRDIPISVRAMKAGAAEFLTNPFGDQDLVDAIRQCIERDRAAREPRSQIDDLRQRYDSLTTREREVMALVASGLLNKQIAAELGLSEITIKVHRAKVMQKSAGNVPCGIGSNGRKTGQRFLTDNSRR